MMAENKSGNEKSRDVTDRKHVTLFPEDLGEIAGGDDIEDGWLAALFSEPIRQSPGAAGKQNGLNRWYDRGDVSRWPAPSKRIGDSAGEPADDNTVVSDRGKKRIVHSLPETDNADGPLGGDSAEQLQPFNSQTLFGETSGSVNRWHESDSSEDESPHRRNELSEQPVDDEDLTPVVTDNSSAVLQKTAEASGRFGEQQRVEPLEVALEDIDGSVPHAASEALGNLRNVRAEESVPPVPQNRFAGFQKFPVKMINRLDSTLAVGLLVVSLQHADAQVRASAAGALGQLGDAKAVEPLNALCSDRDPSVRQAAARAMNVLRRNVSIEPVPPAPQNGSSDSQQTPLKTLSRLDDVRTAGHLLAALQHNNAEVRSSAAGTLGQLGDAKAVETLIALLDDRDSSVRQAAANALEKLGEPAIEPLIASLEDEKATVLRKAAQVLGNQRDPRAVKPLIGVLKNGDEILRREAYRALRNIGTREAEEAVLQYQARRGGQTRMERLLSPIRLPAKKLLGRR